MRTAAHGLESRLTGSGGDSLGSSIPQRQHPAGATQQKDAILSPHRQPQPASPTWTGAEHSQQLFYRSH